MRDADFDAQMVACTESSYRGGRFKCRWCGDPFRYPRRRWCSDMCLTHYRQNHVWAQASVAARTRDRFCQDTSPYEECSPLRDVHHLQPVNGKRQAGCQHHQTNLVLLCQHHHLARHRTATPIPE